MANFDLDLSRFRVLKSPIKISLCDMSQKSAIMLHLKFLFIEGEKSCKQMIDGEHIILIRGLMYILLNISNNR